MKIGKKLEEKIHLIVEDVIKSFIGEPLSNDELMEYGRLRPYQTGLKTDIYIDDGLAYRRNGHPLWVYVVNNYNGDATKLIKIPVFGTESSKIYGKLNISRDDFMEIVKWVSKYRKALSDYADEKIEREDFYDIIGYKPALSESKTPINEMSILRAKKTNLPTDIWVDEGCVTKHGPRIKFKTSNEQRNSHDYSTMTISDNPQVFFLPKNCILDAEDIEKIRQFVIVNKDGLILLLSGVIDLDTFIASMSKI